MDQKNICVIGATTNPDLMPKPLRDRFMLQEELMGYEIEDLATIVQESTAMPVDLDAAKKIAKAAMGTPRKALALLAATEDQALASAKNCIDAVLVVQTFKRRRLDSQGLGPRHLQALKILKEKSRPIGQSRLSIAMGIEREVFRSTVEPELIRMGLMTVTPRGLIAI